MPLRGKVQRFAFVLLVGASLMLLVLGKAQNPLVERFRATVFEISTPVLEILSQPVIAANRMVDEMKSLAFIRDENIRLQEENARLRRWHAVAQGLEQENAAFRSLLAAKPLPATAFISGRVIGDSSGPFVRTILINAGARDGVRTGMAAVTADGLAGRVIKVGNRASRILLLTDLNSRVPVVIEGSRYRAVLEGDNSDSMRLTFLPNAAQVSAGDRVVTSGNGGVFPPGLPVGIIASTSGGQIRVQPFAGYDRLEYVRLLRYAFPRPETPTVALTTSDSSP
jgi:rod shape-determining protein MreC